MSAKKFVIGVVAPSRAIEPEDAARVSAICHKAFGDRVELVVHSQCFEQCGHFAGSDELRSDAFVEVANDPAIHAIWFARGGYGACRLSESAFEKLLPSARQKQYLGYSDIGMVLAHLYQMNFEHIAHGPMLSDINRAGGVNAILRALNFLMDKKPSSIEPSIESTQKYAAFNLTVLNSLIGTPWMPDLTDHIIMVEDIAEHHYQLDRSFFTITSNPSIQKCQGIMLGRCSDIPENDIDFALSTEDIAKYWCRRNNIEYLGRADIGHDSENKIVPFG